MLCCYDTFLVAFHKEGAGKQQAGMTKIVQRKKRRPREGFQYPAMTLNCAAVDGCASRVVAAARGVISLTRYPESADTTVASSVSKRLFAHKFVTKLLRMAGYPSVGALAI